MARAKHTSDQVRGGVRRQHSKACRRPPGCDARPTPQDRRQRLAARHARSGPEWCDGWCLHGARAVPVARRKVRGEPSGVAKAWKHPREASACRAAPGGPRVDRVQRPSTRTWRRVGCPSTEPRHCRCLHARRCARRPIWSPADDISGSTGVRHAACAAHVSTLRCAISSSGVRASTGDAKAMNPVARARESCLSDELDSSWMSRACHRPHARIAARRPSSLASSAYKARSSSVAESLPRAAGRGRPYRSGRSRRRRAMRSLGDNLLHPLRSGSGQGQGREKSHGGARPPLPARHHEASSADRAAERHWHPRASQNLPYGARARPYWMRLRAAHAARSTHLAPASMRPFS